MKKIYLMFGLLIGASTLSLAQGDDCATAVSVTPGSYVADGPSGGSGAVNDDWLGFGSGVGHADWYSFTATCDGTIDVSSCVGGVDTDLFIYQDNCPTLEIENINFNDDGCFACCASEINGIPVTAGTIYYIEWGDQWSNVSFNWDLSFTIGGPDGLNGVATAFNTATLDWNDSGASSWIVEYGPSGFILGTGTILNVSTASDTVITNLTAETTYDFYVTTPSGPCSATSVVSSFTTLPICPEPTGLTSTPGPTTAFLDWTPDGIEVEWDVEYGPNGVLLGAGTQAYGVVLGSDTTLMGLMGSTDYDYYVRAVCDVVAPIDTFSLWVGPLGFTTSPTCPVPTALDTIGGDPFTAGLTWTLGGLETMWNIQWGDNGFIPGGVGSNAINGVTAIPEVITGLFPGSTYQFYVQGICGAGDTSSWAGPFTWTQPTFCTEPSAGLFANLTTTSVDFSWIAGALETNWTIEYGVNGFTLGAGTQMQTMNLTENISSLIPDTDYCFYVQANCGATADSSSAWVGPFCVTTPPSCLQPTNLDAINITNTAANLLWQVGGSEPDWNIEWGTPGFMPGTGNSAGSVNPTSSNPYYATGLMNGTDYEFYVRGICGAGDSSQWSGPYAFSTLCGTFIAPYSEDFDASLSTPNCWSNPNIGETWKFQVSGGFGPAYGVAGSVDHTSGTGNYTWIDGSGTIGANEFTSPSIDFSGLTSAEVGFWILSNNITDAAQNTVTLEVWNGTAWTLLGTYGANNAAWVEVSYTIPAGIPTTSQFRLVQSPTTVGGIAQHNDLLIDDFFVREEVPCVPVVAGTAVAGTVCTNDATDMFDAISGYSDDGGTWYFPSATDLLAQTFTGTGGTMILTGLTEGVDYTFDYVVSNGCSADTVSTIYNWSSASNAGGDGTITTCVNHDVVLIQELNGTVDFGGTWSDDDNAGGMVNGIFSPFLTAPGSYNFTYIVDNGTCSDASMVTVTVEACLGVNDEDLSVLEVYPNPVQNVLTIQNVNIKENFVIEILDVQGKVIMAESYSGYNGNIELDLNTVERGVYIVRLTSNTSVKKTRIIKR